MVATKMMPGRLFKKGSDRGFIMDDELYFILTHSTFNNKGSYYTSEVSMIKNFIKLPTKAKFDDKFLIWITMGPKDLSHLFIQKSVFAVKEN